MVHSKSGWVLTPIPVTTAVGGELRQLIFLVFLRNREGCPSGLENTAMPVILGLVGCDPSFEEDEHGYSSLQQIKNSDHACLFIYSFQIHQMQHH